MILSIYKSICTSILCIAAAYLGLAQPSTFYHLSTAEGLSDNKVNTVARDKNGVLWIGTSEGLNSFDGNSITTYYKNKYPEIQSDLIEKILIDPENRIWIRNNSHYITLLDENRKFHKILIGDTSDVSTVRTILFCPKYGVFALKGGKHYFQQKNKPFQFHKNDLPFDSLISPNTRFIYKLHGNTFAFYKNSYLSVIDYNEMKVVLNMKIPGLCGVSYINEGEILAFSTEGDVFYKINIQRQKILMEYKNIVDQDNRPIAKNLRNISRIDSSRFLITTPFSGLYLYDITKNAVFRWQHDPIDARSLGGNNTFTATYDTSGYLFVTTLTSGLHFFNFKINQIKSKPYFSDANKEIFDGFIQSITTDHNGVLWMAAQDRLIKWDPTTNTTSYIPSVLPDGTNLSGRETFRIVTFDKSGNLWVGTTRNGVLIFNADGKIKKQFSFNGTDHIPSNWINAICEDMDGNHWIGTRAGLCMIDKNNQSIKLFKGDTVFSNLSKTIINTIWKDPKGKLWIGTTRGVFCYDKLQNNLTNYSVREGLTDNNVFAINQDLFENTYFGTSAGLSILSKDGKIKKITRENGLQNNRCEGILRDSLGYMWIGNLSCILRYDPSSNKFIIFEDGHGFNHGGFRMRSAHKAKTGEMFWGTDKGINWFLPGNMTAMTEPVRPFISTLRYGDTTFLLTESVKYHFPYNPEGLIFNFSSGELTGISKTKFLYKLVGLDNSWQNPVSLGQAIYNKLPSGNYTFFLKASRDGIKWYEAPYVINIEIDYPWWEQNWFRFLSLLLLLSLGYIIYQYFLNKKKRYEMQSTIDYFANSGYEHSTVDDILWDICRNVIARFGFEDCVIYLLDDEKKVLIQKAAMGSKSPNPYEIKNPIEIPIGQGIVGSVALDGKSIIVNDTSKDSRYIVDDKARSSEISIPILHEGKVIGVIDSEHSKKNFYTDDHQKNLTTLSIICGAKISKALALEAMKKTKLELLELNIKMAESRFSNLRLQMNPHFLFNSLSAIQHLIVSEQTQRAYKYLTVFSNFLRSLLNFASENFLPLEEEIKILKMYIELESLRFDQSFKWEITADQSLDSSEIFVPSLLIQPFAENAIWHGLLHKDGEKKLKISFTNFKDKHIICTIEDNGVGRNQAALIKQNNITAKTHQSKGIQIIKERLDLFHKKTGKSAKFNIEDICDASGTSGGTKVSIILPFYNPEEL
ncbi:MAG: histidine kinase [Saprospiraceae bacterium]|nr:histidine kinase [Saprospiraceae bacterium]